MDPIKKEEHQEHHHSLHRSPNNSVETVLSEESQKEGKFKAKVKKVFQKLGNLSLLEIAGILAIMILFFSQLFEVSIAVSKRPIFKKILGNRAGQAAQKLPPTLASGSQPAPARDKELESKVLPAAGVELPVTWGDLGKKMVDSGVIDRQKFEALYTQRGGLSAQDKKMLLENGNGKIKITAENSSTALNLLWALGLGNKNEILDKGEMQDKQYGGAGRFASTGGWTLATGDAMQHYSKHYFMNLTAEQQALVDRVSKNIYRPCCGNSTHFPDCNHGMAMLGLLELMASQGANEQDMYKAALAVNSFWFPDNYLTIAAYFKSQGTDWSQVTPQTVLSAQYSSSQGYQQLLNKVTPQQAPKSKSGCGV